MLRYGDQFWKVLYQFSEPEGALMRTRPATPYANEVLWQAIADVYGNVSELCRREGLPNNLIRDLLHAKVSPIGPAGHYHGICLDLAEIFAIDIEELFAYEIYQEVWPVDLPRTTLSLGNLSACVVADDPEVIDLVMERLLEEKIDEVLQTLTYRERQIIKLRYGLADGDIYTLEEVSRIFKITRERVRQIEAKAVRKLQHPQCSNPLKAFL